MLGLRSCVSTFSEALSCLRSLKALETRFNFRVSYSWALSNFLFNSMLNEIIGLIFNNDFHKVFEERILLGQMFELLPLLAFQNFLLIQTNEIDAKLFKFWGVVGMSNQENRQNVLASHKMFYVVRTNLHEAVQHKVVGIDEQLQEKLNALVADEEFVRIEILYDAIEKHLRNSFDFDQSELLAEVLTVHLWLGFFPLSGSVKHGSKVFRSRP